MYKPIENEFTLEQRLSACVDENAKQKVLAEETQSMFLGVFAKFFSDCKASLDLINKGKEIEKKKRK